MAETRIEAPWSDAQVASLVRFQTDARVHPFTCPREHTIRKGEFQIDVRLMPTTAGWICPVRGCDYKQTWAHVSMLARTPCQLLAIRSKDQHAGPFIGEVERSE